MTLTPHFEGTWNCIRQGNLVTIKRNGIKIQGNAFFKREAKYIYIYIYIYIYMHIGGGF